MQAKAHLAILIFITDTEDKLKHFAIRVTMNKILFSILLLFSFISAASIIDFSDNDLIKQALDTRDDYYTRHLGNFQRNGFPKKQVIQSRLQNSQDKSSPWYYFLMGESTNENSTDLKNRYYQKAISATNGHIGNMWVLFLEFHKVGLRDRQNQLLDSLEYLQLSTGIEVLPSIEQQLHLLAINEYNNNDHESAQYCLEASTRFSTNPIPVEISKLFLKNHTSDPLTVLSEYNENYANSWQPQVALLDKSVKTALNFCKIIFAITLIILLFYYYSRAIHPLSCMYPKSVPYQMRFFFTTLLIGVSGVLGLYPLLILLIVLLIRTPMNKMSKAATRVLLVLLILYPFTMTLNARLSYALSDDNPAILYEKALRNQPTAELYSQIKNLSEQENPDEVKALHLTSMALIQFKRNSTGSAVALIRLAHELWPDNEPVLMAAGSIYHKFGDTEKAFALFNKAIELFPESPQVNYNFGQINLEKVGISNGTDFIDKGASLAPKIVNGFITRNSHFFGESSWPSTRLFFLGALSPDQYWDKFMVFTKPPKGSVEQFWGSSFFGLPTLFSLIGIAVILGLSSLIVPSYMQVKKNGECVLCGKSICKKCRINDICNECHSMLQNISNESLISSLKVKLSDSKRVAILLKAHICDILFPGTRDLFLKKKSNKRIFILLPLTVVIYTAYSVIIGIDATLLPAASLKVTIVMLIPGLLFNLYFLISNLKKLIPSVMKGGN